MDEKKILHVDVEEVVRRKSPRLARKIPKCVFNFIKRTIQEERINRFLKAYSHKRGVDFAETLLEYLDGAGLERNFLDFARREDGLTPSPAEWAADRQYLMTQVRALVGRYSRLGDNAYYHLFLKTDDSFKAAVAL